MKKLITIIGILALSSIVILNMIFIASIGEWEHVTIEKNFFIYILGLVVVGTFIYIVAHVINKYLYKESENAKVEER